MSIHSQVDIVVDEKVEQVMSAIYDQYEQDILLNVDSIFATLDRMSRSIAITSYKRISGEYPKYDWVIDRMSSQVKIRLIKALNKFVDESLVYEQYGREMNNE